ncbi:MAG: hypothetical protein EPN36_04575 [Rhodanobacteraceae bacterium]|nr:MAG: hypothetical protein EPN36_04575 [Rhodanobacteraceae bacterium]
MKTSGWLIAIAVVTVLVLQGCAGTGSLTYTNGAAPPLEQSRADNNSKPIVKADNKADFEAVVAAIHKQMEPGGRWQYVDKGERATIDGSFSDMSKLFDQYGSVDKMDQAAKVRLLADQSTVNAILTKKDGDRLICQSQIPVGSHLPVKTCKTYAQIQAEQRNAQETLRIRSAQNSEQLKTGH